MSTFTIMSNPNILQAIIDGCEQGIATICSNVRSQAVTLSPFDTGELRNSIVWKTSKSGIGEIEGIPTPKPLNGYVGSALEYSVYQEFGTRNIPPHPYLRPAIAMKALGQRGADVMIKRQNEMAMGKLKPENITKRETFNVGSLS